MGSGGWVAQVRERGERQARDGRRRVARPSMGSDWAGDGLRGGLGAEAEGELRLNCRAPARDSAGHGCERAPEGEGRGLLCSEKARAGYL